MGNFFGFPGVFWHEVKLGEEAKAAPPIGTSAATTETDGGHRPPLQLHRRPACGVYRGEGKVRSGQSLTLQNPLQQLLLRDGHFLGQDRRGVVVAGEVEEAVEGVEEDFLVGFEAVFRRAITGDSGADEDFAVREGDDIRLGRIVHELAVDARDGGAVDQDDVDFRELRRQRARQERDRRLKPRQKRTDLNRRLALLV